MVLEQRDKLLSYSAGRSENTYWNLVRHCPCPSDLRLCGPLLSDERCKRRVAVRQAEKKTTPSALRLQTYHHLLVNLDGRNDLRFGYPFTRRMRIQYRTGPKQQRLTPIRQGGNI